MIKIKTKLNFASFEGSCRKIWWSAVINQIERKWDGHEIWQGLSPKSKQTPSIQT